MRQINITISDISLLNLVQESLLNKVPLSENQQNFLCELLEQMPTDQKLISDNVPFDEVFNVAVWEIDNQNQMFQSWIELFSNLPGWDYSPMCFLLEGDAVELLHQNIIMKAVFAPSLAYLTDRKASEGYEIRFKGDGTARFWFPTFRDVEAYPELYSFKGSWKEAYLLLIETLKKGWPTEGFPEELRQFLKK